MYLEVHLESIAMFLEIHLECIGMYFENSNTHSIFKYK
jgi:hypothetical protein